MTLHLKHNYDYYRKREILKGSTEIQETQDRRGLGQLRSLSLSPSKTLHYPQLHMRALFSGELELFQEGVWKLKLLLLLHFLKINALGKLDLLCYLLQF